MRQASSLAEFLRDPIGTWCASGCGLAWCHAPTLVGAVAWGAPSAADVADFFQLFAPVFDLPGRADVVLDGRGIESVEPEALAFALGWLEQHRASLAANVRLQIGVLPDGVPAATLMGMLPLVGDTHPFRAVRDARDALRGVAPEPLADALHDTIEQAVAEVRGVAPIVRKLREAIDLRAPSLTLHDAAKRMALSTRTLQRALGAAGTSFQIELRNARFEAARRLLASTDQKVASVAIAVGLGEGALTQLFKERLSITPAEYRRKRDDG